MYKIYLNDEQMDALKLAVNFADTQVDDGLGVFVSPAPLDMVDEDEKEADKQYDKQLRLKAEINKILTNADWLNN